MQKMSVSQVKNLERKIYITELRLVLLCGFVYCVKVKISRDYIVRAKT